MKMQWLGEGSVRLQEKSQRVFLGLSHVIHGGSIPKFKEDLVFLETSRDTYPEALVNALEQSSAFVVDGAGEYSYQGVTARVKAIRTQTGDKTHLVSLNFADLVCASLSALDRGLEPSEVDFIGTPDILFIPVGGYGVMDTKQAVKAINTIQPRIVIPTYAASNGISEERNDISAFVEEYAVTNSERNESLTLKSSDLPSGTTQTYLLEVTR